jgi:hypothetical protein
MARPIVARYRVFPPEPLPNSLFLKDIPRDLPGTGRRTPLRTDGGEIRALTIEDQDALIFSANEVCEFD